jgi:hypothetical protein
MGLSKWIVLGGAVVVVSGCGSSPADDGAGGGSTSSGATAGTANTGNATTGIASTGSGSTDNTTQCEKIITATCAKIYMCDPATTEFPNEAACNSMGDANCMGPSSCAIDSGAVDTCVSDLGAVACTGGAMNPPSCAADKLCKDTGQPYCLGTGVSDSGQGCTLTLDNCSDSHTYAVACDTTCTCTIDGASPKTVPMADYCSGSNGAGKKSAITACGWNLYFQ